MIHVKAKVELTHEIVKEFPELNLSDLPIYRLGASFLSSPQEQYINRDYFTGYAIMRSDDVNDPTERLVKFVRTEFIRTEYREIGVIL